MDGIYIVDEERRRAGNCRLSQGVRHGLQLESQVGSLAERLCLRLPAGVNLVRRLRTNEVYLSIRNGI